jgi:hypothetical protein
MSPSPAIALRTLAGDLRPPPPSGGPPTLVVDRLAVRLYQAGVDRALQQFGKPNEKVEIEQARIQGDEIVIRGSFHFLFRLGFEARLTVAVTAEGHLRVTITGLQALSFLPVPTAAAEFVMDQLQGKPGIVRASGTTVDVDPAGALRDLQIDALRLPPLQAVLQDDGWLELVFRAPAEEAV